MTPRIRRRARDLARAATLCSAAMFVLGLAHLGDDHAAAAPAGTLTIVKGTNPGAGGLLQDGGTATVFALRPPAGAACAGDGPAGYRIQTFIVSSSISVDTLKFDGSGPSPTALGGPVRVPLFSTGNPVVDLNPALTTGAIVGVPSFDFSGDGLNAASFPNGSYTMGIACTRDTATGKVLDKYWSVGITVTASAADQPNGFTWALASGTPTTTTTTAAPTSTVAGTTTTTTAGTGGTTTTDAATDTTSVEDTTAGTDSSLATDTTQVDSGAVGGDGGAGGVLVSTGSSPTPTLVWGVLLVVFGRMAVLLARPVRVIGADEP